MLEVEKGEANLCRYPNQEQPLERCVGTIVDNLTASQTGVSVKHLLRLRITCNQEEREREGEGAEGERERVGPIHITLTHEGLEDYEYHYQHTN